MTMRDRYLTFDGVNLKDAYGLIYSTFEEELPEPKTITVDIPAGTDLDITDALGPLGWHNGKHTIKFLLYGETEAERLQKKQAIIAKLHGVRANYKLSWDSAYTYTGRAKVSVEHRSENVDVVTVEIDRAPWKVGTRERHEVNCHPKGRLDLTGSAKYRNLVVVLPQQGAAEVSVTEPSIMTQRSAGTYTLASEVVGDSTVWLEVSDWLMYVDETDLIVKASRFSVSGSEATINATGTVTDGDLHFADADNQIVIVAFDRWDV